VTDRRVVSDAAQLRQVLAPLRTDPGTTGIFSDFDGTLSPIVEDPAAAGPVPGVVDALGRLADRYARVGLISGRPVAFLEQWFGPELELSGLYGLEQRRGGEVVDDPRSQPWRPVVAQVVVAAGTSGPPGMRVESKGISLTVHFREHPELEAAVRAWAEVQARRTGLELRPARMSFELHPPVPVDKGTALLALVEGLTAVCFLGDDVGDLAAFAALDQLRDRGVATVKVAAHTPDADPAVAAQADHLVDGPHGALAVLELLYRAGVDAARSWSASQSAGTRAWARARSSAAVARRTSAGASRAAASWSAVSSMS
jgi:trehalose 6-phosphate phosphatase